MLSLSPMLFSRPYATRALSQTVPQAVASRAVDVRHPYFVPRNTKGSIPVYSDIRNGGTRYLVSIRNVEGQVDKLAGQLRSHLFAKDTAEHRRLKVRVIQSRHVELSGANKDTVIQWLRERGF